MNISTHYDEILKLKALFETRIPGLDYKEKPVSKKEPEKGIDRVILNLESKNSEIFTKLAYKYAKAKKLLEKLEQIKDASNQGMKKRMSELFDATDKVYTRVVETKSLIATLSKELTEKIPAQPARQENRIDYENIAKELIQMLDGDLLKRAEDVMKKYTQTIDIPATPEMDPKQPGLRVSIKNDDMQDKVKKAQNKVAKVTESDVGDKVKIMCKYFNDLITSWAEHYDLKLDKVRKQLHAGGKVMEEDDEVTEAFGSLRRGSMAILSSGSKLNTKNPMKNWLVAEWSKNDRPQSYSLVEVRGKKIIVSGSFKPVGEYQEFHHDQSGREIGAGKVLAVSTNPAELPEGIYPLFVIK